MDTPITKTLRLRETVVTAACVQHPERTYYADGTRVRRRGMEALRSTLGTTVGMTVDVAPYDYQIVKWDDGTTTHTSPHVLALVRSQVDAPESPACRKIAGSACGYKSSRVWEVQWTAKGPKDRRHRYVHDVEDRLTGERESTLYPDPDKQAALYAHFELADGWRKAEKASA